MDLLVCGDALWISCGTWVAFWNGVIGASVAAVAGAVVALIVVRLTNAQQQHGVDKTIEVAAIGDFVASVTQLEWATRYKMPTKPLDFDTGLHILPMMAAVARFRMARPESSEVADMLIIWPEKVRNLVIHYQLALSRELAHSADILDELTRIAVGIQIALPQTLSKSRVRKSGGLRALKDIDARLENAMRSFEKALSDQYPDAPRRPTVQHAPARQREVIRRRSFPNRGRWAGKRRFPPA